ncbi:MAG: GIY-YIG nuclease family protein [Campylobacterota bacterium]|nr:GIY-YIG nuclease family protein [Campylobacterota bacterium]
MDRFSLDDILENDPLGLLGEVKVKNPIVTPDDRLIESFEEINQFYKDNGCEPKRSVDMNEIALSARLSEIRKNQSKINMLKKYDTYNLLKTEETIEFNSIEDIFANDDLGIFNQEQEDIFTLKNVPKIDKERAEADFVARRKKCENFEEYENLFKQCQKDLKDGKRKLIDSVESKLDVGVFCVLDGVLLLIVEIKRGKRGNSNKINRRTTIVFENGTQSNMLLRSLGKRLKNNGKMLTKLDNELLQNLQVVTKDDKQTGYIYILESLSNDDRILTKKDLYKIGFSTTDVKQRIKNTKNDPTYLMADVKIVDAYKVYDANPHKLEQLIHRFFAKSCLDIDIVDSKGDTCKPREWFVTPLPIIEESIKLIINGKIIDFYYDEIIESIKPK